MGTEQSPIATDERSRRHGNHADEYTREVVDAKPEALDLKADDARAARPDHLDRGAIVKPHLAEPMDQIAGTEDFSATHPLAAKPPRGRKDRPESPSSLPDPMPSCVGLGTSQYSVALGQRHQERTSVAEIPVQR